MKSLIGVCGSDGDDHCLSEYALLAAESVGRLIAKNGGVLVCGGRGGVMEAACRGAKEEKGITVGILPDSKNEANEFVDIAIPTQLGHMRNYLVVRAADAVIALGGRWGTLNEISFALILKKPVVLLTGTGGCVDDVALGKVLSRMPALYSCVNTAEDAVAKAFASLNRL